MPLEIERKFLVSSSAWRASVHQSTTLSQGYLNTHKERTVRVRIAGARGILTIKGQTINTTRQEFEYDIPLADAQKLLLLCEPPIIEKTRHLVKANGLLWEIDVFEGVNKGLIVAEVELQSEKDNVTPPSWIGKEVSNDPRYYNSNLINHPFQDWE